MKKVVSCLLAIMLVMFAAVPVFAAEIDVKSPQGTTAPYYESTAPTQAGTSAVIQKDTSPSSPKTGRNDAPVYAVILFALAACSVATVKYVKSK